jgi:protoporphyrinogen oxidase
MGLMVLHAQRIKQWQRLDDMTVREYIVNIAGQHVYDIVWKPLLHGKFGPEAERVSAAWLWSKLTDRGGSRNRQGHELLGYLRGGLGRIFETIVSHLQNAGHVVHLGEAVQRIHGTEGKIESIDTGNGPVATDAVIGCAQVPDIVRLLPESTGEYKRTLERIGFLANVCLVLTLNRSLSEFYWTNVTDPDAPFVGIIEHTRLVDRSEYHQKHLVYVSSYVVQDDARLRMTAEDLMTSYMPAIKKLFPEFDPECIEAQTLWTAPYAQPIVHVGYRHAIPAIVSPIQNFFLCTMAQIYPNDRQVSNGVATGRRTAQLVVDSLNMR